MKIILIKDCDKGKINEIIDVSLGYATNFLIKKGIAIPYNKKTQKKLQNTITTQQEIKKTQLNLILKQKTLIEKLLLKFELNVKEDMKVHNSITKKQILKKIKDQNIKINNYALETVKINKLGIFIVKIFLNQNIVAKLKLEVVKNGK